MTTQEAVNPVDVPIEEAPKPLTKDEIAAKLETIYLLQQEIELINQQCDGIIKGVHDQRLSTEDRAVISNASSYATAHTAPLRAAADAITSEISDIVVKVKHDYESEHMTAKLTKGKRSGATIDEIETFSRILPKPFSEMAAKLVKEGKLSCKIVAK